MTTSTATTTSAVITREVQKLPARDVLALVDQMWEQAQAKAMQAPAMTCVRNDGDGLVLVCPHCHTEQLGVLDIDMSVRWTTADRMEETKEGGVALWADYGYSDFEGSVLVCESCQDVVTLPSDVEIVAV